MKKTLLAAIIASELPKPCITLDLFKSDDRVRAYGGMRCPGRVTVAMKYQQLTHNERVLAWMDDAIIVDSDRGRLRDWINELNPTPVMGFKTLRKEGAK